MANSYTTNPIIIDTTFTTGYRANATSLFPLANPLGLAIYKVIWKTPGASASFSIQETSDSLVLLSGSTPAAYAGPDPVFDFEEMNIIWRNFKVPTLSAGTLYIYGRLQ
jgi:hypothetical protein